ncbi:MAG TPA: polysaccharide deacetylase family protein [Gaiellaceae bacterium]
MRRTFLVLCAALVAVPVALASREDGFHRRPHVPLQWEQHRIIAKLAARGAPVYCGAGRSNAVALTFDDGPGPYTDPLVEILRENDAHATFFVVGNRIPYWPGALRAEAGVGVVGNHSFSHPRLTELPRWLVWLELLQAQHDARAVLGWKPRLFRAPYERHDPAVDEIVRRMGMLEILWSVDSRDWVKGTTPRRVVRNVTAALRPGAIVVLHDIHPWTVQAMPGILHALRLRGLRAVSVPELLALDPPRPWTHCGTPAAVP